MAQHGTFHSWKMVRRCSVCAVDVVNEGPNIHWDRSRITRTPETSRDVTNLVRHDHCHYEISGLGHNMRMFVLAGALFAVAINTVGCSADGSGDSSPYDTPVDEAGKKKSPSKAEPGDVNDGHYTLPTSPSEPTDPSSPATPTDPVDPNNPTTPTTPTTPTAPTTPAGAQTLTCTASTGGHKSVTSIVFTLDNGVLKIDKMSVDMTNKDARNKNDIDVYVTPSGGAETKSFNSGDILPNAKITIVPLPSSFVVNAGAKVRVLTNFDTSFADPSASCIIQF
jgi:hypothetical protein